MAVTKRGFTGWASVVPMLRECTSRKACRAAAPEMAPPAPPPGAVAAPQAALNPP
eukprot:CAMPEP_0173173192 /NCGR_PEP_ID=MMETSP1141-20130122/2705_1 /TAXON_ID=483371 /ORGANISM="non described non described, Strain CCMP2298" /LENGTH=54 /DNA_ID=CAMNT_0014095267 /DNA_START=694 /DNA_END=854 /DNA_ORIENTATION=+